MSPDGGDTRSKPAGEIYFELIRQGNFVKATAIDPESGAEASIVGPASAAAADLQALAVAKLRKQLGAPGVQERPADPAPEAKPGRGIIV